jgi:hypothetical protein
MMKSATNPVTARRSSFIGVVLWIRGVRDLGCFHFQSERATAQPTRRRKPRRYTLVMRCCCIAALG